MASRSLKATVLGMLVQCLAAGASLAWGSALQAAEPATPAKADAATIADGARIAALGDCMFCHTAEHGKPYAGGRSVNTPFGTIYSINITPDAETGIGNWSQDDFKRAMRDGVSRDGHLLYPAFPYQHFTRMNDKDIAAAYAYLMSRDPVTAPPPENQLDFPFNFRPLLAGWNLLFRDRGERPADPAQTPEWNRGRYLVDGLGHCAACHTPMNALGGEKRGEAFAGGGLIDGWEVPPLNNLAHAHVPWTKEQLASYLRTGLASEHGAAAGPMAPVTHALADAPQADIEAIATYLLSLQPSGKPATATLVATTSTGAKVGPQADQARIKNGATLFAATCASCHGTAAPMSAIGGRPSLSQSTAVNAGSPRNVLQLILGGIPFEGSTSAHFMPPFANTLTDTQIADVAIYLRSQYSHQPPWTDVDGTVAKIRKEDLQQ